ncbi:uncharacterized protein LOC130641530 isoform X1 [Hydractinia symbiolongicarpus]|uniref:uncharacterized protein LOC130641530 isoform X1 n=1 Tax=Hydractinia symbiolongicarpus TaxID=13093 RepID=UPI00254C795B|nr:uncharacterized protein LOC130641530 isoform X1 [Hydractinia symbiolongicarpus]
MFQSVLKKMDDEYLDAVTDDAVKRIKVTECLACNEKFIKSKQLVKMHKNTRKHHDKVKLFLEEDNKSVRNLKGRECSRSYSGFECMVCNETFVLPDEKTNVTSTENHKQTEMHQTNIMEFQQKNVKSAKSNKQEITPICRDTSFSEIYEHISRNNLKQLFEAAKIDEIGDVNIFITSVFEEVLGKFWPQPKSQFHCRICNYKEFATLHLKEEHITSIKHKRLEESYEEAFCLACQTHCIDQQGMQKHLLTDDHTKLAEMLTKTKKFAIEYWQERTVIVDEDENADATTINLDIEDAFISELGCLLCNRIFKVRTKRIVKTHKSSQRHQKKLQALLESKKKPKLDKELMEDSYIHRDGCTLCSFKQHMHDNNEVWKHKISNIHQMHLQKIQGKQTVFSCDVQYDEFVSSSGCLLCNIDENLCRQKYLRHKDSVQHLSMLRTRGMSPAQIALKKGEDGAFEFDQKEKDVLNDDTVTDKGCQLCDVVGNLQDFKCRAIHILGKRHKGNLKKSKGAISVGDASQKTNNRSLKRKHKHKEAAESETKMLKRSSHLSNNEYFLEPLNQTHYNDFTTDSLYTSF